MLYRRPNIGAVSDAIIRSLDSMGTLVPTGLDAPLKLLRVLEAGGHVCHAHRPALRQQGRRDLLRPYLQGQSLHRRSRVTSTAPFTARVVRLLDKRRFRVDLTEAIEPRRDPDGKVDVAGTMQAVTSVVEGWVREHPEQWLWVQRRWR